MSDLTFPFYLGPYKVVAELGTGGFATVYRAVVEGEMGFSRDVALKVLHPHITRSNPEVVKMLADEARLLALMQHPNIVNVQWFGQLEHPTEGRVYAMMMEYVPGRTLRQVQDHARRGAGGLPTSVALDILLDVARGLKFAHELRAEDEHLRLVHRDLKPDNVMISAHGAVKLLDFGIAKASQRLVDNTETNMIRGTVHYMSPEQVRGEELDFRSDLFSFGAMLYESLVGARMIAAKTLIAAMHEVAAFEPGPRMSKVRNVLSEAVPVLDRLLAPAPADRYRTTAQVVEAIQRLRDLVPTSELASAFLSRQVTRIQLGSALPDEETADLSKSAVAAAVGSPGAARGDQPARVAEPVPASAAPPPVVVDERPGTTSSDPVIRPSEETVAAAPGVTRQMATNPDTPPVPVPPRPGTRSGVLFVILGALVLVLGLWALLKPGPPPPEQPTDVLVDVADPAVPEVAEPVTEAATEAAPTPAPEATTPAPEATTPAPEATTPAPEATTPRIEPPTAAPEPETPTPTPEPDTPDASPVASAEPGKLRVAADSPFELSISHRRYTQLEAGRGIDLPAGTYRVRVECIQCPDGVKPTREVSVEVRPGETTKELVVFKKEG